MELAKGWTSGQAFCVSTRELILRGSSKGEGAAGLPKLPDRYPYRHGTIDVWVSALMRIHCHTVGHSMRIRRSKKKGFPNEASARRPSAT